VDPCSRINQEENLKKMQKLTNVVFGGVAEILFSGGKSEMGTSP
jgi:hypothetical protein